MFNNNIYDNICSKRRKRANLKIFCCLQYMLHATIEKKTTYKKEYMYKLTETDKMQVMKRACPIR